MCVGNKGPKTKTWQGFLSCAPGMTIMSLVTKNSPKPAFAPLVAKTLAAKKVITLRWEKEVSFAHQPYCALESVPDRIRWLRMQMGLTQKEAAEKIGIHIIHVIKKSRNWIKSFMLHNTAKAGVKARP